jgi:RNA polymerase sigma-70 factor (ECF subfamily)
VDEDVALFDGWVSGDERAARALFERYFTQLFRFFRNKVGASAEDLVQDTFLGAMKNREGFRRESSFRAYLFGVARNVLRMHYRTKRRKQDPVDFGSVSAMDMGPGPVTELGRKAEHRLLLEA